MKEKVFRPHLDDVENLTYGKGAKKQRGTGSRFHCHRLNRPERTLWELAKQAGYLTVRTTGYRKERKGSPLHNSFRQRCDALHELCVVIEKFPDLDRVLIDFSTLRVKDDAPFVEAVLENVFQSKYPEFYRDILERQLASTRDVTRGHRPLMSIAAPMDWETVQTKPIWAVKERIISVDCARDVAKSIAADVLKESQNFDFSKMIDDAVSLLDEELDNDETRKTEQNICQGVRVEAVATGQDDDSCIDWDDI